MLPYFAYWMLFTGFNSSLYKPIYYEVYPIRQFHVRLSRDYMYMHTFTQT